jgi:hypothetical protein
MPAKLILLFAITLLMSACATGPRTATTLPAPQHVTGDVLTFLQQDTDGDQDVVRFLISDEFMRIEYNSRVNRYDVFDRLSGTLYQVNNKDRLISVYHSVAQPTLEHKLEWRVTEAESFALPRGGSKGDVVARHYQYSLNGEPCLDVVAVDAMLPLATAALAEYRQFLAGRDESVAEVGSAEYCHLAQRVYEPELGFKHGFPLREWNTANAHRFLQDAKQYVRFERQLFELPKSYERKSGADQD